MKTLALVLASILSTSAVASIQLNLVDKVGKNISGASQEMMDKYNDTMSYLNDLSTPFEGEYALTCGNKTAAVLRESNMTSFVMDNKTWSGTGYNTPNPIKITSGSLESDTEISMNGVPCEFVKAETRHSEVLHLELISTKLVHKFDAMETQVNITQTVNFGNLSVRKSGNNLILNGQHGQQKIISKSDMKSSANRLHYNLDGEDFSIAKNFNIITVRLNDTYPDEFKDIFDTSKKIGEKIKALGYR